MNVCWRLVFIAHTRHLNEVFVENERICRQFLKDALETNVDTYNFQNLVHMVQILTLKGLKIFVYYWRIQICLVISTNVIKNNLSLSRNQQ